MNPVVTRKSEATRSASRRPVRSSSPKPLATAIGEGKTDSGNTRNSQRADQTARANTSTTRGSRCVFESSGFSGIRKANFLGPKGRYSVATSVRAWIKKLYNRGAPKVRNNRLAKRKCRPFGPEEVGRFSTPLRTWLLNTGLRA